METNNRYAPIIGLASALGVLASAPSSTGTGMHRDTSIILADVHGDLHVNSTPGQRVYINGVDVAATEAVSRAHGQKIQEPEELIQMLASPPSEPPLPPPPRLPNRLPKWPDGTDRMIESVGRVSRVFDHRVAQPCGATVHQPISKAPCVLNYSFGCSGTGGQMFVARECRAIFLLPSYGRVSCGDTSGPRKGPTICPTNGHDKGSNRDVQLRPSHEPALPANARASMTIISTNADLAWDAECTADSRFIWRDRTFAVKNHRLHHKIRDGPFTYLPQRSWFLLRLSNGAILNVSQGNVGPMHGVSALVYTDSAKTVVVKQTLKFMDMPLVEREACVLRKLSGLDWSAKILCFDPESHTMVTTHVGAPLGPADLLNLHRPVEMIGKLVEDLEKLSIQHLDIAKTGGKTALMLAHSIERMGADELARTLTANRPLGVEVYLRNGRLSLVDFNTAKVNGTFACSENMSTKVPSGLQGGTPDRMSVQLIDAVRAALMAALMRARVRIGGGTVGVLGNLSVFLPA